MGRCVLRFPVPLVLMIKFTTVEAERSHPTGAIPSWVATSVSVLVEGWYKLSCRVTE